MDTLRLAAGSVALMLLLLSYFVGVGPIMLRLYDAGLWPRPSIEAVQNFMNRGSSYESLVCHEGTNGWDFICDAVSRGAQQQPIRHKHGVMGSPFGPVGQLESLPLDQPVPPREGYREARIARVKEEAKRRAATLDLNRAREAQVNALPGVDDQLSRRIVERVIAKRLKTVDELLTIDGMDQELLDRIRPLVRVDK